MLSAVMYMMTFSQAFVPHPLVKFAGETPHSITHKQITEKGFIRSLLKLVNEQRQRTGKPAMDMGKKSSLSKIVDAFIDEAPGLFESASVNLEWDAKRAADCGVFKILKTIVNENAMQDIRSSTKKVPSVHFDAERIIEGNDRLKLERRIAVDSVFEGKWKLARLSIGRLLHTLQDFYSHTNWVEMGKSIPNYNLGINDDIGKVAPATVDTCFNEGCEKIVFKR
ncbi:hypothetical protein ACOME3_007513 [Neoechinorhynchus agilis]